MKPALDHMLKQDKLLAFRAATPESSWITAVRAVSSTVLAWGELGGAYVRCRHIHGQMHLAPPLGECTHRLHVAWQGMTGRPRRGQRLAATLNAVLAGLTLRFAQELDPGAVHQKVQVVIGATAGNSDS